MERHNQEDVAPKRERSESPLFEPETPTPQKRAKHAEVSSDTLPDLYTIQIQQGEMSCEHFETYMTQVCERFSEIYDGLKSDGLDDKDIASINEKFRHWSKIRERYPTIKPAVLVGAMGAGKSTLINTLTDEPGVAIENEGLDRGTCVPHRHMGPEYDQLEKFRINAMFNSDEQIKDSVELLCKPIHNLLRHRKRDRGDQGNEDQEARNEARLEEEEGLWPPCQESIHTLQILLRDEDDDDGDFASEDAAIQFFSKHYDESADEKNRLKEAQDVVYGKIIEFKNERELEDDVEKSTAEDPDGLVEQLFRISKPPPDLSSQHPWPIVREVQIRQCNPVLASGVTLIDTPGVNDKNATICHNAEACMEEAGVILVVAPFMRAGDDEGVEKLLKKCIKLRLKSKTRFVVTKADTEVKTTPAWRGSLGEDLIPQFDAADRRKKEMNEEKKMIRKEVEELKKLKRVASPKFPEDGNQQLDRLDKRQRELSDEISDVEKEIFQIGVRSRAKDAKAKLEKKFRTITGSEKEPLIPVHVVANDQYGKILADDDTARLDREETGVPELQRLLCGDIENIRWTTLDTITTIHLPAALDGIIGVLTKNPLERKEEVKKDLTRQLNYHPEVVEHTMNVVGELFLQYVDYAFDKNIDPWRKQLTELIDEWATYNSANFRAFCRKSGNWKLSKKKSENQEFVSWNELIQKVYAQEMNKQFTEIASRLKRRAVDTEDDIKKMFEAVDEALNQHPDYQSVVQTQQGTDFSNGRKRIRKKAIQDMKEEFEKLRDGIEQVKNDMIIDEHVSTSTHYVADAMQSTYDQAEFLNATNYVKPTKGTRATISRATSRQIHQVRVDYIKRKFRGLPLHPAQVDNQDPKPQPSVFAEVLKAAQNDFEKAVNSFKKEHERIMTDVVEEVKKVFEDCHGVSEEPVVYDPEQQAHLIEAAKQGKELLEQLAVKIPQKKTA